MSSGALKTAGANLKPIQSTRTDVMALAAAGKLKAGNVYAFGIDPGWYENITGYFLATSATTLSEAGTADFLNAKYGIEGSFSNPSYVAIGVYNYTGGTRTINQVFILNNDHYLRLVTGPDSDPITDTDNWRKLDRTTANGFVFENCPIVYDIKNDKIISRTDRYGNRYHGGNMKYFAWGNPLCINNLVENSDIKNCNIGNDFSGNIIKGTTLSGPNNLTPVNWTDSVILKCTFDSNTSGYISSSEIKNSSFTNGGYSIYTSKFNSVTYNQVDGTFTNCNADYTNLENVLETDFTNCTFDQSQIQNCQSATEFLNLRLSNSILRQTNNLTLNDVDLISTTITNSNTIVIASSSLKFSQITWSTSLNIVNCEIVKSSHINLSSWQFFQTQFFNTDWNGGNGNNSQLINCYFRNYSISNTNNDGSARICNGHIYTENEIEINWRYTFYGSEGTGQMGDLYSPFSPISAGYILDYLNYKILGSIAFIALTKLQVAVGGITLIPEQSVEYIPPVFIASTPTSGLQTIPGTVTGRITSDGESGQIFSGVMEFRLRLKNTLVVS